AMEVRTAFSPRYTRPTPATESVPLPLITTPLSSPRLLRAARELRSSAARGASQRSSSAARDSPGSDGAGGSAVIGPDEGVGRPRAGELELEAVGLDLSRTLAEPLLECLVGRLRDQPGGIQRKYVTRLRRAPRRRDDHAAVRM